MTAVRENPPSQKPYRKKPGRRYSWEKLKNAVCEENAIYVVTEKELLSLVPAGGTRVFVKASLDTIKERFAERMHGVLPPPVAAMPEKKYGQFGDEAYDLEINTDDVSPEEAAKAIIGTAKK